MISNKHGSSCHIAVMSSCSCQGYRLEIIYHYVRLLMPPSPTYVKAFEIYSVTKPATHPTILTEYKS